MYYIHLHTLYNQARLYRKLCVCEKYGNISGGHHTVYLGDKSCSFMFTHKLRALTCVIEIFLLNEFSKGDQDLTINVKKSAENPF